MEINLSNTLHKCIELASSPLLLAILGVVLGNVLSTRSMNKINMKKLKLETFSRFHAEYSQNMADIVASYKTMDDNEAFDVKDQAQRKAVVVYFLKFQGFYLQHQKELIDTVDFNDWEKEFDRQMNNIFFSTAWEYLKTQMSFSCSFEKYVDSKIKKPESLADDSVVKRAS